MPGRRRAFLKCCSFLPAAALAGAVERCHAGRRPDVRGLLGDVSDFHPLWEQGGSASVEQVHVAHGGRVSGIRCPGLHVIRPVRPNGAAVIIAAGGGYGHLAIGHEALPAARWLVSLGITAAILFYRLPEEGWTEGMEAPMADAQQVLHLLRSGKIGRNIDAQRVAFLGFSAGGHLLGLTALQGVMVPPALLMLLYPVVSVAPPFTGSRTSRICLGHDHLEERAFRWSLPPHVRADAPSLFLAHAVDDPIVSPEQAALLVQAYQRQHRPCEEHHFPVGGHGFGMGDRNGPTGQWPALAESWMRRQGFI